MNKIILRDWHNAICKVANVTDKQLEIIKAINEDMDNAELYETLEAIEYTNENHRTCTDLDSDKLYDGYYGH